LVAQFARSRACAPNFVLLERCLGRLAHLRAVLLDLFKVDFGTDPTMRQDGVALGFKEFIIAEMELKSGSVELAHRRKLQAKPMCAGSKCVRIECTATPLQLRLRMPSF